MTVHPGRCYTFPVKSVKVKDVFMGKTATEKNVTSIAAVDRALNIMELLYREKRLVGINEIASLLGEYPSTTHRIVTTLRRRGYVFQDPESSKYGLGYKVYMLGQSVEGTTSLLQLAKPYAVQIAAEFQETVNVGIRVRGESVSENGYRAITLLQERGGNRSLRSTESLGEPYLCYYSGIGKVLMAFSPDYDENLIHRFQFEKHTKKSIVTPEAYIEEMKKIREQGYAIDDEENEEGLYCIASPVLDGMGTAMMALSVSGFAGHVRELNKECVVERLQQACREIGQKLL